MYPTNMKISAAALFASVALVLGATHFEPPPEPECQACAEVLAAPAPPAAVPADSAPATSAAATVSAVDCPEPLSVEVSHG